MVLPRIVRRNVGFADYNCPWQHPEQIRGDGLVQVPKRARCEKDCGKLGADSVKDIAPVDGLVQVSIKEQSRQRQAR